MDVLSDILSLLKFKGCLYYSTRFRAPWGIEVPSYRKVARYHMVVGGSFWVRVKNHHTPELLHSGDLVVVPHGASHILSDSLDSPVRSLDDALTLSNYPGAGPFEYGESEGPETARLVCGHFEYDAQFEHPLMSQLPAAMVVRGSQALEFAWFDQALKLTAYEAQADRPGNEAIVKKLTEILFIHVIRVWRGEGEQQGFFGAVSDQHINRGLQAIHSQVARKWSLQDLAKEAGLSRTVFSERFRHIIGVTPMQYLTDWRMQKAKRLLIDNDEPVELVAESVGYDSPAAFSRVFKKSVGTGPGSFRRTHKESLTQTA